MSTRLLCTLASLVALALAGAGGAGARTDAKPAPVESAPVLPTRVKDVNGKTVVIRNASRIVPLNGDIAETIFTLGLSSRVVGVDTSALYPKRTVDRLPKIGYQRTLSAEGILSLRPTVVIGSTEAGPPTVIEQIRAAGVPVLIIPEIVTLNAAAAEAAPARDGARRPQARREARHARSRGRSRQRSARRAGRRGGRASRSSISAARPCR